MTERYPTEEELALRRGVPSPHISLDEARAWLESLRGTKWVSVEKGENGREWPVGDLAELFLDSYASLEEQYRTALDLLARVQLELAPNHAEADELRRKFGLGGSPPLLDEIAEFISNPAKRPT